MRRAPSWLLGLSLAAVASAAMASDYPVALWKTWLDRSTGRCPGQTWSMYATPEEAGWSSEKLQAAKELVDSGNTAAAMVIHDGAVVAAWGDVGRRYNCHSVRKSLLSALIGVHVAKGDLDLEKTLAELGIDDDPPLTDAEKQARVIDLLRARSGVYHKAAYEPAHMKKGRPVRGSHGPGEIFWYNNWDFNTLGAVFEQQTGVKIFDDFARCFAEPLEMEDYRPTDGYYHVERDSSIHPAYPFRMSARDLARIGLLYLRKGNWADRCILPAKWVSDSITSHLNKRDKTRADDYAYGYLWWPMVNGPFAGLGMYSARGHGGHSIDVIPAADVVFVHRVDTFRNARIPGDEGYVTTDDRLKLIDLILKAKVAPPKADPKLVPLPYRPTQHDTVDVDPGVLARYVGAYKFKKFTFAVERKGDDLWIDSPEIGHFRLIPLSETRFVIEDMQLPVTFVLDGDGRPASMVADFGLNRRMVGGPID